MRPETRGLSRSVHTRLIQHAQSLGLDENLVLNRFAVERLLYRLSRSPHAERFVLKGALLMLVWLGETVRPTRDADLLGFGDLSDDVLAGIFRDVCLVAVEPDAMTFPGDSVRVSPIRPEDAYGGKRVTLYGQARLCTSSRASGRGPWGCCHTTARVARLSLFARSTPAPSARLPAGDRRC